MISSSAFNRGDRKWHHWLWDQRKMTPRRMTPKFGLKMRCNSLFLTLTPTQTLTNPNINSDKNPNIKLTLTLTLILQSSYEFSPLHKSRSGVWHSASCLFGVIFRWCQILWCHFPLGPNSLVSFYFGVKYSGANFSTPGIQILIMFCSIGESAVYWIGLGLYEVLHIICTK